MFRKNGVKVNFVCLNLLKDQMIRMKKAILIALAASFTAISSCTLKAQDTAETPTKAQSIHTFKVKDIDGKEFDFASLKGKKYLLLTQLQNVD